MDGTKHFSTQEAARILQSTEARVRTWARLGGLMKERPDGGTEFTFQQLLLLRTTRGLLEAGIPARRVKRVWSSLRRQLKTDLPLTSVRILADGDRAIAWDETASWQPDSGQFLLDFEAEEIARRAGAEAAAPASALKLVSARCPSVRGTDLATPAVAVEEGPALSAEQWFDLACELEDSSPAEARQAYLQSIAADPDFADAHLNLGRLEHEAGELGKAEACYQRAVQCNPNDPTAHFNLAVLLEDRGRPDEALQAYHQAILRDPEGAGDAHYNLGLLLEARGRREDAMRHLMAARRLYEGAKSQT